MEKLCKYCETTYPTTSIFWYTQKDTIDGLRPMCKKCTSEASKKWRIENKDRCIKQSIKSRVTSKYGITVEEYLDCMGTSDVCQICGDFEIKGSASKALCYDHDHTTGKFRGILCRECNQALGKLGDNIEGVQKVIDYLSKSYVEQQ